MKHRLFVLTDITSLERGVREPDDGQSMIRLMLYANEIDIEGLVASSNLGHGQQVRPELIHQVVDAYEQDWPVLSRHEAQYPNAIHLREVIRAGQPNAGPQLPVDASIGEGKDTPASDFLIEVADKADDRPLWVAVWGGTADLAQALIRVRATRTKTQLEQFVAKLRIHAVYDQDSTAEWIKREFPGLFYITRKHGIRGMYRGGDMALVSSAWVAQHVRGMGALGKLYPNYDGGDIWSGQLGRVHGIKEGDTPSWLNLIGGGDPLRGWGGTFVEVAPNRWDDAPAEMPDPGDPDPRMIAIHRHRAAYQADFARRLAWCNALGVGA